MITVKIDTKNTLNLDKGQFSGNEDKAKDAIESFCSKNKVTYEAANEGQGGTLSINDEEHDIELKNLDIQMMLQFCGIDEATLANSASQDVDLVQQTEPQPQSNSYRCVMM